MSTISTAATKLDGAAPFAFQLTSASFVSGGTLHGQFSLDLQRAQALGLKSARVQLRGTVHSAIYGAMFTSLAEAGKTAPTAKKDFLTLEASGAWKPGRAFPLPGTGHIVQVPFTIELPGDMAPSFEGRGTDLHAFSVAICTIDYALILRGTRSGLLKKDVVVHAPVRIVAAAAPEDVRAHAVLLSGLWDDGWKTLSCARIVRSNAGDEAASLLRAELRLPNLASYPVDTPLPYLLHVLVQSTPHFTPAGSTPHPVSLPVMPSHRSEVKLLLKSMLALRVKGNSASATTTRALGGLGSNRAGRVRIVHDAVPIWVSTGNTHPSEARLAEGSWQQTAQFEGTLTLTPMGSPTFSAHGIMVSYALSLEITLNEPHAPIIAEWPLVLNSGVEAPPPPFTPLSVEQPPSFVRLSSPS